MTTSNPRLTQSQIDQCARLIANAYLTNTILDGYPQQFSPSNLQDAVAIQERAAELTGWKTIGWKTGYSRPEMRRIKGDAAPIICRFFEGTILKSPAVMKRSEMHNPLVEGELAALMGKDLPPREKPYTWEEVRDAIKDVVPVIEFADIRTKEKESVTPYELTALNGGSFRVIVGEPIPNWRDKDLQQLTCHIRLDDRKVATEYSGDKRSDFAWVMHFLANRLSERGIGMRAGEYVATGVILDYMHINEARHAVFALDGVPEVSLTIV